MNSASAVKYYAMFINDLLWVAEKYYCICYSYDDNNITWEFDHYNLYSFGEIYSVDVDYDYDPKTSGRYTVEFDEYTYVIPEILNSVRNIKGLRSSIAEIDRLVICGGGYFNYLWKAKHRKKKLFSILAPIIVANEMGKPIVFLGNTYGPWDTGKDFFSVFFRALRNVSYAARDNYLSPYYLREVGVEKEISVLPDDLYFLHSKLKFGNSTWRSRQEKFIVFECYPSMDDIEENISHISEMFEKFMQKTGVSIMMLYLDRKYGGEYQAKLIEDRVKGVEIAYNSERITIEDIGAIVRTSELVICQRYHLFLTALSNDIPCVSLLKPVMGDYRYYYCKVKGLLDQVFSNQNYQESIFVRCGLWDELEYCLNNADMIIEEQQKLFNSQKVSAEDCLLKRREKFLKQYL